ncbi:hypothetical protein EUGRSUZ_H01720 [Eucalyptus grandis]|uniref:Uncharacterized protein n=2 Tax=Eucalyptus grandis TaxID=71139 RepID=A0ACC3JPU1_EUCGR|nr:hypothetical protein EUGRSUZ_H01720 [Eucalyptus grandis]
MVFHEHKNEIEFDTAWLVIFYYQHIVDLLLLLDDNSVTQPKHKVNRSTKGEKKSLSSKDEPSIQLYMISSPAR